MSRQIPYLQRRGDTLFFRIGVPSDLRARIGAREITKTLRTADRRTATPLALLWAAKAKQTFNELRGRMSTREDSGDELKARLMFEMDLHESGALKSLKVQAEPHEEAAAKALIQTAIDSHAQARQRYSTLPTHRQLPENPTAALASAAVPTFHQVIDGFLKDYDGTKHPSMYVKLKATMPMLREFIGDIPVTSMKQKQIVDFFNMLPRLPDDWKHQSKRLKKTLRQLAEQEHPKKLGPAAFKIHQGCVRQLLVYAVINWQDEKFPTTFTVDGIKYKGDREKGEEKQRALSLGELRRMFEGPEMKSFADDPALAHQFWLPHIGLFTGARVNEICQLNPQTDILKDLETGINYFLITEETEADSETTKSVKTGRTLKVPMHKQLLELGFLEYVERVKATGAKRIFQKWRPIAKRAAGNAQLWFDQFLRETGLRDETPFLMITGMHCFRDTLSERGATQGPPIYLTCITGHVQKQTLTGQAPITGAALTYYGESLTVPLDQKAALLNQLDYGLNFFTPKH